jgi:hypothetical protein
MSCSRVLVSVVAALLLASTARLAHAQASARLEAIGAPEYTYGRSNFRVGSWVSYHVKNSADSSVVDDYTVTLLVAGEEELWGEECFWLETWTQRGTKPVEATATLLSSSIFDDSLPTQNVLLYQRKSIPGYLDDQGKLVQQLLGVEQTAIKSRAPLSQLRPTRVDTLGTDTLKTAQGSLGCLRVLTEEVTTSIARSADSTQYLEVRDERVACLTPLIPVTGKAHEETESSVSRRAWLTGQSQELAPWKPVLHSKSVVELVSYGTAGLEARLIPEEFRRSLAEQRAGPPTRSKTPQPKPRPVLR